MKTTIYSNAIASWLASYADILARPKESTGPKIQVSDVASKLAFLYEKVRNTIDYKEDHLIRKSAISRIIKRILTAGKKGSDLARPLIEELIRGRYLPNSTIPESVILTVRDILNKYIIIYNSVSDKYYTKEELKSFFEWLVGLAGCEIEETLVPAPKDRISLEAMHRVIKQTLAIDIKNKLPPEEEGAQIFIAVLRAILKADEVTVSYNLIKYYFPDWHRLTLAQADQISVEIKDKQRIIKRQFSHSLHERLTREFKKYAVVFWILRDIVENNPQSFPEIFSHPDQLKHEIVKVCNFKYSQIRSKVRRSVIRSVLYLFMTKMMFGIMLELPYDYFILKDLQWLPLGINALFPPALMAFIGICIKRPKADNTALITEEAAKVVFARHQGQEYRVVVPNKRKGLTNFLLQLFYFAFYAISFGGIIYGLRRLEFSVPSIIIFLLFLTMVSFFSLRITKNATELIILPKKEKVLNVIAGFLVIPILRVGRWISFNSSKINVFIFVFDFVIESPFKLFVRTFEDLIVFVKEKRDEMM